MHLEMFLSVFILMLITSGINLLDIKTRLAHKMLVNSGTRLLKICQLLKISTLSKYSAFLIALFLPSLSMAADEVTTTGSVHPLDLTQHWSGYMALIVFAVAYILAMTEEV
ncbi:MAG: hypothetical protein WC685_16170, partial [Methylobacter sp.]